MNRIRFRKLGLRVTGLTLLTMLSCTTAFADDKVNDEKAERQFTLKVLPILKDKCFGCHGSDADDIKGDYNMLTRESLLMGGETGDPAVVPGKPDEGTLIPAIAWEDMELSLIHI